LKSVRFSVKRGLLLHRADHFRIRGQHGARRSSAEFCGLSAGAFQVSCLDAQRASFESRPFDTAGFFTSGNWGDGGQTFPAGPSYLCGLSETARFAPAPSAPRSNREKESSSGGSAACGFRVQLEQFAKRNFKATTSAIQQIASNYAGGSGDRHARHTKSNSGHMARPARRSGNFGRVAAQMLDALRQG